jgi:hypothetical protein
MDCASADVSMGRPVRKQNQNGLSNSCQNTSDSGRHHGKDTFKKEGTLIRWWPVALPVIVFLMVYAAYFAGWSAFYQKHLHETLAMVILPIAFVIFLARTWKFRHPLYILLTCLTGAFFLREWHFRGTSTGIYIALAVLGFLAWQWRKDLEVLHQWVPLKIWLIAAFLAYVLSQFIARRGFRILHLPLEKQLHVPLEEVLETVAHTMMLIISILSWRFPPNHSADESKRETVNPPAAGSGESVQ